LNFCGAVDQSSGDPFNYTFCPSYGAPGSSIFYWNSASAQFAQLANGNLWMLGYAGSNITSWCVAAPSTDSTDYTIQTVTVSCDSGSTITAILFSSVVSLESSGGICTAHSATDSCSSPAVTAAANGCIGKMSCNISAAQSDFMSPCGLTGNMTNQLTVQYQCLGPRLIYRTGSNPSIFASVEIVNLNATNILTFTALIIDNPLFPTEACGSGSVLQMETDLSTRTDGPMLDPSQVFCTDNPAGPAHLMCVDNTGADSCSLGEGSDSTDKVAVGAVGFVIGAVVSVLVFGAVVYYCQLKNQKGPSINQERLLHE